MFLTVILAMQNWPLASSSRIPLPTDCSPHVQLLTTNWNLPSRTLAPSPGTEESLPLDDLDCPDDPPSPPELEPLEPLESLPEAIKNALQTTNAALLRSAWTSSPRCSCGQGYESEMFETFSKNAKMSTVCAWAQCVRSSVSTALEMRPSALKMGSLIVLVMGDHFVRTQVDLIGDQRDAVARRASTSPRRRSSSSITIATIGQSCGPRRVSGWHRVQG